MAISTDKINLDEVIESSNIDKLNPIWKKNSEDKLSFYLAGSIFSFGFLNIACKIYPNLKYPLTTNLCSPIEAEFVCVKVLSETGKLKTIHATVQKIQNKGENILISEIECVRYYATKESNWVLTPISSAPKHFVKLFIRNNNSDVANRNELLFSMKSIYGPNRMSIPEISVFDILIKQMFSPFFIFQYFSVILWCIENYVAFSMVILVITIASIYTNTSEELYNLRRLHELAGKPKKIRVLNDSDAIVSVFDFELAPGQRYLVDEDSILPCDSVLLNGRVVVDESMLTGESVLVSKTFFDTSNEPNTVDIDLNKHSSHILFSGTKVKKVSPNSIAMVYRTGFRTTKGELLACLLITKEENLGFFSDALLVILFMFLLSSFLYIGAAMYLMKLNASGTIIFIKYLDSITIAVPPALTTCLIVATSLSVGRLTKLGIFVSDTSRVNWAGTVQFACFDKTGTLTSGELKYNGLIRPDVSTVTFPEDAPLLCEEMMATCHSLSVVNGIPSGDPLEIELFKSSGWQLKDADNTADGGGASSTNDPTPCIMMAYPPKSEKSNNSMTNLPYKILKHFEFSSEKLRAGSLLMRPNGELVYLVKGSPEIILKIANISSKELDKTLADLARQGHRLLAFAYRKLPSSPGELENVLYMDQEKLESDLKFLSLVSLSNALKPDSSKTISSLSQASIGCKMITGDHIYTAISVAKDCNIFEKNTKVYFIDEDKENNSLVLIDSETDLPSTITIQEILSYLNGVAAHHVESGTNPLLQSVPSPVRSSNGPKSQDLLEIANTRPIGLAITGKGINFCNIHDPLDLLFQIVKHARVFARTKPYDKQYIVQFLMNGHREETSPTNTNTSGGSSSSSSSSSSSKHKVEVLFCGDGANDMTALRSATVGVSLCDAETSVAAPITSKYQNPESVVDVIKEGRCSLVTAYVLVNFNIMYGVIQLFMVLFAYTFGLQVGNYIFLLHDLFFTLVLGLCISNSPPAPVLSKNIPPLRFFCPQLICKLIFQLITFPAFQAIGLVSLYEQPWYKMYKAPHSIESLDDLTQYSHENTVLAIIGLAQLMIASIVASIDEPFRVAWYKNKFHLSAFFFQIIFLCYMLFSDEDPFLEVLQIKPLKTADFRWAIFFLIIANLAFSLALNNLAHNERFLSMITNMLDSISSHLKLK